MKEEIDRYKRLLDDWNTETTGNGASPKNGSGHAAATVPNPVAPAPKAKLMRPASATEEPGRFPAGAILCVNDEEMVIYRRPVSGKPFDMVYSLLADGTVKIEAMDLVGQQIEVLGQILPEDFKLMQTQMRWGRRIVAAGCKDPEVAQRIPNPEAGFSEAQPTPQKEDSGEFIRPTPPPGTYSRSEPSPKRSTSNPPSEAPESSGPPPAPRSTKIRRGQRITVQFGNRAWEAIYWGRDQTGSVVAHNTHRRWSLMHLDLDRFKESLVVDPEPNSQIVEEISRDLSTLVDFE